MLERLCVQGFKSLKAVDINLPALTVLFGPNAAGKSNVLDAVQALSRIGTSRTLSEALSEPIRGHAIETFAFPQGGLPALLSQDRPEFSLEAYLGITKDSYRYRVAVCVQPNTGTLSISDEYLTALTKKGEPRGNASIERVEGRLPAEFELRIRRKSKPAKPRSEPIGLNYSLLSDPRLSSPEYRAIERCRTELMGWRVYYLDPRSSMRVSKPPADVQDIGVLGEDIAPFLYRLHGEKPKHFDAIKRTLRTLIPTIDDLSIDLDKRRGTLDITIRHNGTDFSSRIVSEGTLRVVALCAISVNPWGSRLVAFEEPENGVHPRRLELIAELLTSLAIDQGRQVIVTTHSPLFCDYMLEQRSKHGDMIALLNVRRSRHGTEVEPLETSGPLFADGEIRKALAAGTEDGLFQSLLLRGLLDE